MEKFNNFSNKKMSSSCHHNIHYHHQNHQNQLHHLHTHHRKVGGSVGGLHLIKFISIFIIYLPQFLLLYLTLVDSSLTKHIERYSHPDIQHFKPLLFDVKHYELLVGARDHILILNLNDFGSSVKRDHYIPPTTEKKETCRIKGMKLEECHNFITTLLPIPSINYKDQKILVCGTNAYSPECEIRRLGDSFEFVSKSASINSFCPRWNTSSLITTNGDYFYGGPVDLRGIDSSIIKQKNALSSKTPMFDYVRTAQYDPKWISSDANFVFSFEYDQHVYFLFRETAVEYLNIGRKIYSRIGRVCKDDPGRREVWTSFLKARINCSLPGAFPFYFDEIQSVDVIDNGGTPTLYAIFNTPQNSIHGSAVCAFTMNSVLEAFNGPFKHQQSSNHIWERVNDNHQVFECHMTNISQKNQRSAIRFNSVYQQVDDAVQPVSGRPFIIAKNEQFRFIAVDLIKTKYYDSVEVIFVATTDGKLLKYVKWPYMNESCLVDEIQLIDPNENKFLSMKFLVDTQSLYFGTEKEVIRMSVHQCHNYHTKTQCVQSGDPYCGWSETKMKCVKPPGNNFRDENWIQSDQPTCLPRWSKWFTCNEAFRPSDETCKCRKKPCTFNSEHCFDGYEFEVTNCTRTGGWSEWTPWSSCSPSCGRGVQFRTRNCNNPFPSNGRKLCSGPDREERQCDKLPYCTWSQWSEWTNCSLDCNGLSKRTRQCLDYNGNPVDQDFCQGPYLETNKCVCNKTFEWTDWSITDLIVNEVVEQRLEIEVMHKNREEQRVVSMKYCDYCGGYVHNFKGKDYLIKECSCTNDRLIWSDWTEWTPCHNEIQIRERSCLLSDPLQCDGHFKEIRHCQYDVSIAATGPIDMLSKTSSYRRSDRDLIVIALLCIIMSSLLTAFMFYAYFFLWKAKSKPELMMNHTISSEPNTYEEPEKYRVLAPLNTANGIHAASYYTPSPTRIGTIKREFSFKAKLDDSNY